MKVEMLAKIIKIDGDENCSIGAYRCDKSSEGFYRGIGKKRIIFQEILRKFNNGDTVRIKIETVKESDKSGY